jgi:hypothetical protein
MGLDTAAAAQNAALNSPFGAGIYGLTDPNTGSPITAAGPVTDFGQMTSGIDPSMAPPGPDAARMNQDIANARIAQLNAVAHMKNLQNGPISFNNAPGATNAPNMALQDILNGPGADILSGGVPPIAPSYVPSIMGWPTPGQSNVADPTIAALAGMLATFHVNEPTLAQMQQSAHTLANGQYDPRIAAVTNAINLAVTNAKTANTNVSNIYNKLQGFYQGQLSPINQMFNQASSANQKGANALRSAITQDYTQRLKSQVNMYKDLGIQAAAKTTFAPQTAQEANQVANAAQVANAERAALNVEHGGDIGYLRASMQGGQAEKSSAMATIASQLANYQNQQGGVRAGLQGDKAAAYFAALQQQQANASNAATNGQNSLWTKMIQLAQLKNTMGDHAFQQLLAQQNFGLNEQRLANSAGQSNANRQAMMNELFTRLQNQNMMQGLSMSNSNNQLAARLGNSNTQLGDRLGNSNGQLSARMNNANMIASQKMAAAAAMEQMKLLFSKKNNNAGNPFAGVDTFGSATGG